MIFHGKLEFGRIWPDNFPLVFSELYADHPRVSIGHRLDIQLGQKRCLQQRDCVSKLSDLTKFRAVTDNERSEAAMSVDAMLPQIYFVDLGQDN